MELSEWLKEATKATLDLDNRQYDGLYLDSRVNERQAKKKGYNIYSFRESDDGQEYLSSLRKGQHVVNFSGSFLTKKDIPINEDEIDKGFYLNLL
jgi:hypothetical protein